MFVLKENPFININNSANWNFGIIQIVTLILLGVICASNPIFITIIWSIFIIYTVYLFMIGKTSKIWYFVAMSPGLEILGRMVYTSALPLELGKYYLYLVIILFSFSALIHTYKLAKPKYYIGGVMILILLPSVIVSCFYNSFTYQNYIFNY